MAGSRGMISQIEKSAPALTKSDIESVIYDTEFGSIVYSLLIPPKSGGHAYSKVLWNELGQGHLARSVGVSSLPRHPSSVSSILLIMLFEVVPAL